MGRFQPKLPQTADGYEERLRRVQSRTVKVLDAPLSRDPEVIRMGTQVTFRIGPGGSVTSFHVPAPDPVQLAYLAMLARPFTLSGEQIHYKAVVDALLYFASTHAQRVMSEQLLQLWAQLPAARTYMYAARDGQELLPGGATDAEVADRVLYSQLVHADDAAQLLDHVDTPRQRWSLAGMVGDWIALIAHQQHVLRLVRPDLCKSLAKWPGTPTTIFERLGASVQEITDSPSDG